MMSPWAVVELMRQQTCVSCQCHPEGDVSSHGGLSLSLADPASHHDVSLTPFHSTSRITIPLHFHLSLPVVITKTLYFSFFLSSTVLSYEFAILSLRWSLIRPTVTLFLLLLLLLWWWSWCPWEVQCYCH